MTAEVRTKIPVRRASLESQALSCLPKYLASSISDLPTPKAAPDIVAAVALGEARTIATTSK